MGTTDNKNAISAYVEHDSTDALVRAIFVWPNQQPQSTYTIGVGKHVSLELDREFSIRPASITLHEQGIQSSRSVLARYIGEELVDAMVKAPELGFQVVETAFNTNNRRAIAELQVNDPSTPAFIVRSCAAALDELNRPGRVA